MVSIQKIIVERVQLYIRREIKKHLRLRDEETRRMQGNTELALLLDTNPATVNRGESGRVRLSRRSCGKVAKIRSISKSEVEQAIKEKNILAALNKR